MKDTSPFILIVEDDPALSEALHGGLMEVGYGCRVAGSVKDAEEIIAVNLPGLILLDMGLPDGEGAELLDTIRKAAPALPVIITTARSELTDRLSGLERGADDYLVKPYAFEELLARIRIQLRHAQRTRLQQQVGDLHLDLPSRTATRGGRLLDLTPREFDLLVYLSTLQGDVATREMLQHEVWKVNSTMTSMDNVIDVHISRLRQKLDGEGQSSLLHTVRGVGFVLKEKP
ncbi:MAG: response regulator transcription factor [Pontiellaceae bacterium]|nr:response regulator transcription factor [Pontiellaceae bacterium]MBN2785475.1 response regulator transcription factor [Pontiellaceae bacterium]